MAHSRRLTLIMCPTTTTSHRRQSGYWLLIYMIISALAPRHFGMQIWENNHLLFGRAALMWFVRPVCRVVRPWMCVSCATGPVISFIPQAKPRLTRGEASSPSAAPCWDTGGKLSFRECHLKWLVDWKNTRTVTSCHWV